MRDSASAAALARLIRLACIPLVGLLGGPWAQASQVTEIAFGQDVVIPVENYIGSGPKTVAAGISWSSPVANSLYGYNQGFGFTGNGFWGVNLSMVGLNDPVATMTFAFDQPVAGFGGFLNYSPSIGPAEISIYGADSVKLDSYLLSFATGGGSDRGEFHGFVDNHADIYAFKLTGAYVAGANFVVLRDAPASVPEPDSGWLILLGMLCLVCSMRNGKSKLTMV